MGGRLKELQEEGSDMWYVLHSYSIFHAAIQNLTSKEKIDCLDQERNACIWLKLDLQPQKNSDGGCFYLSTDEEYTWPSVTYEPSACVSDYHLS